MPMVALPSVPPPILPVQAHLSVALCCHGFRKQVSCIGSVPVSHLFEYEIYEAADSWMHPLYTLMVRGRFAYGVDMFSSTSELWVLSALQPVGPLCEPYPLMFTSRLQGSQADLLILMFPSYTNPSS